MSFSGFALPKQRVAKKSNAEKDLGYFLSSRVQENANVQTYIPGAKELFRKLQQNLKRVALGSSEWNDLLVDKNILYKAIKSDSCEILFTTQDNAKEKSRYIITLPKPNKNVDFLEICKTILLIVCCLKVEKGIIIIRIDPVYKFQTFLRLLKRKKESECVGIYRLFLQRSNDMMFVF